MPSVRAGSLLLLGLALASCSSGEASNRSETSDWQTISSEQTEFQSTSAPTKEIVVPGSTVTLSVGRDCYSAHVWAFAADDTVGVGVIVDAERGSASEPSVFTVAAHQLVAFRGTGLAEQVCSGTGTLPSSEQLDVVSGSGTLTLDPLGVTPATGRFQTGELVRQSSVASFGEPSSRSPQDSIASDNWALERDATARFGRLVVRDDRVVGCFATRDSAAMGAGSGHVSGPPSCSSSRQRGTRNSFP